MNRKDQEEAMKALEAKLLAALESEPEEMGREDWDRLRAQVRRVAADRRT